MGFLSPKAPAVPALPSPPPAAHPAVLGNTQIALSEQASKSGAAAGMGFDKTLKTSTQGLPAPSTAKTTLLGGVGGT